ncbi:MAG: hypothetical protein MZV70_17035 [Desulfobacterales bacterium]|nr:hypothetical protein [Desulfobacterales bacterium]
MKTLFPPVRLVRTCFLMDASSQPGREPEGLVVPSVRPDRHHRFHEARPGVAPGEHVQHRPAVRQAPSLITTGPEMSPATWCCRRRTSAAGMIVGERS